LGINFAEGGQSSTGSIIRWAKNLFGAQDLEYSDLDDEAAVIKPGCDGLIALETFQGSRTPVTDPLARGALVGLTLSHTRAHIWRALMEAVCFGTRACIDGLENAGHLCNEIIIAGGTTRSKLWLQMHADVTNKPVVLCENIDAPLLGCAILASVVAGVHSNVQDAVKVMVRESRRVEPNDDEAKEYDNIYKKVYSKLHTSVRPLVHSIASLRGGAEAVANNNQQVLVSPSLLACDWANIESEIKRCLDANLKRLHIDVFDGVSLDSPDAFTFGPQMVKAMRSVSNDVILDVHLCVDRPTRFVESMQISGASRIIFQWEAMTDLNEAILFAKDIVNQSMKCGISINPETEVEEIIPLLETGLCDTVNVLGVNPGNFKLFCCSMLHSPQYNQNHIISQHNYRDYFIGFGGQKFQHSALRKIQTLRSWVDKNGANVCISIDGGVNDDTAELVKRAGANILVAGSYLFKCTNIDEGSKLLISTRS
jgi:pentose-5-phosphate-3-epimerase